MSGTPLLVVTTRQLSDAELVALARSESGSAPEAEHELCLRLRPRVRVFLARRLASVFEVDDIAQDVLISLLQAIREDKLQQPERLASFVRGICLNKVREVLRKGRRKERAYGRLGGHKHCEIPEMRVEMGRLEECLHKLSDRERTLLRIALVEGQSSQAAGEALKMSPGNVRVVRHRTIDKLRRCMRVELYEVQRR